MPPLPRFKTVITQILLKSQKIGSGLMGEKMKKFKGFANYEVPAHEKEIVFTASNAAGRAAKSEEIEITLPDDWETEKNQFGELLICGPVGDFLASKILASQNDKPVLMWHDGNWHMVPLVWSKI